MSLRQWLEDAVSSGCDYLHSQYQDGSFMEDYGFRHGRSQAWSTAYVGSSLAEFESVSPRIVAQVCSLQFPNGGWAYNQRCLPDADTTLRAVQFLQKAGLGSDPAVRVGLRFVTEHQRADGGIATYLPENLKEMGYPESIGWADSHPCVTALAVNILPDGETKTRAIAWMRSRLSAGNLEAYWWRTPLYVAYETGNPCHHHSTDSVELALELLLKDKIGIGSVGGTTTLLRLQRRDGSFPSSHVFRVPRVGQLHLRGDEEPAPDRLRMMSTSAAVVALRRQQRLLYPTPTQRL